MSFTKNMSVDFGSAKGGLSTVEYQLYNSNGTPNGSAVTTGITEIPDGTYVALVTFPNAFQGVIRWSSGEASPVYASEDVNAFDATLDVLTNTVPGGYEAGTAGYALGLIGTAQTHIISHINSAGDIEITEGYDQTLTWVDTANVWPDLTNPDDSPIDITFLTDIKFGGALFTAPMEIVQGTGTNKSVRLVLAAADTNGLGSGIPYKYTYDIQAEWADGRLQALEKGGRVTVLRKP